MFHGRARSERKKQSSAHVPQREKPGRRLHRRETPEAGGKGEKQAGKQMASAGKNGADCGIESGLNIPHPQVCCGFCRSFSSIEKARAAGDFKDGNVYPTRRMRASGSASPAGRERADSGRH
jgi:hypothetical protein